MEKSQQMSLLDDSTCGELAITQIKKKKKRKQLEINIDYSLIELNLLLLPLAPMGREKDYGTIKVQWVDSNNVKRGIKVSMTDDYKMLTSFDIMVLNALMKIYSEQNKNITLNFDTNKYDMPVEINYTAAEIARVLKYKSIGSFAINKVQNSIKKLANCTITSIYEGGIYDTNTKKYIKSEQGYHIIESYEMYTYRNLDSDTKRLAANKIKNHNKVKINDFFYKSMCSGYCKIIPFEQLVGLKHDISQRLFSLLEGWYCDKKPFVYFRYETLYSRIPLNPVTDGENPLPMKEKNRIIKKGADELLKQDYIKGYIVIPMKGMYFIFDEKLKNANADSIKGVYFGLDKYNGYREIIEGLIKYGIEQNDIDTYVHNSVANNNLDYVAALLRYYEMMLRYDNIKKNPKQYLLDGLKGNYNIERKYYSQT